MSGKALTVSLATGLCLVVYCFGGSAYSQKRGGGTASAWRYQAKPRNETHQRNLPSLTRRVPIRHQESRPSRIQPRILSHLALQLLTLMVVVEQQCTGLEMPPLDFALGFGKKRSQPRQPFS